MALAGCPAPKPEEADPPKQSEPPFALTGSWRAGDSPANYMALEVSPTKRITLIGAPVDFSAESEIKNSTITISTKELTDPKVDKKLDSIQIQYASEDPNSVLLTEPTQIIFGTGSPVRFRRITGDELKTTKDEISKRPLPDNVKIGEPEMPVGH